MSGFISSYTGAAVITSRPWRPDRLNSRTSH